jgi:hypothetical protein
MVAPITFFIGAFVFLELVLSTSKRDKAAALSAFTGFILLCVIMMVSFLAIFGAD